MFSSLGKKDGKYSYDGVVMIEGSSPCSSSVNPVESAVSEPKAQKYNSLKMQNQNIVSVRKKRKHTCIQISRYLPTPFKPPFSRMSTDMLQLHFEMFLLHVSQLFVLSSGAKVLSFPSAIEFSSSGEDSRFDAILHILKARVRMFIYHNYILR